MMVNFVDAILDTSQTGGVIKYNLIHADSTTEQVQLAMATPVQTQGTPLNKATFDSIQTDLTNLNNNKLNVSSKATQSEAEAGTNDTKYMTPLKVQQKLNSYKTTYENSTTSTSYTYTTILNLTNNNNTFVKIHGSYNTPQYADWRLIITFGDGTTKTMTNKDTQYQKAAKGFFEFNIDTFAGIIYGEYIADGTSDGVKNYYENKQVTKAEVGIANGGMGYTTSFKAVTQYIV